MVIKLVGAAEQLKQQLFCCYGNECEQVTDVCNCGCTYIMPACLFGICKKLWIFCLRLFSLPQLGRAKRSDLATPLSYLQVIKTPGVMTVIYQLCDRHVGAWADFNITGKHECCPGCWCAGDPQKLVCCRDAILNTVQRLSGKVLPIPIGRWVKVQD